MPEIESFFYFRLRATQAWGQLHIRIEFLYCARVSLIPDKHCSIFEYTHHFLFFSCVCNIFHDWSDILSQCCRCCGQRGK